MGIGNDLTTLRSVLLVQRYWGIFILNDATKAGSDIGPKLRHLFCYFDNFGNLYRENHFVMTLCASVHSHLFILDNFGQSVNKWGNEECYWFVTRTLSLSDYYVHLLIERGNNQESTLFGVDIHEPARGWYLVKFGD